MIERILSRNGQRLVALSDEFKLGLRAGEIEHLQQELRRVIESREAAPISAKPVLSGMADGFQGD